MSLASHSRREFRLLSADAERSTAGCTPPQPKISTAADNSLTILEGKSRFSGRSRLRNQLGMTNSTQWRGGEFFDGLSEGRKCADCGRSWIAGFMNRKYVGVGVGIGLGLCFGAVLGTAMHNVGVGVAFGVAIGVAFSLIFGGAALRSEKGNDSH